MSLFITIEGIEGAGKSTLISGISKHLASLGMKHITTREPGGTPLGESLRKVLLSSSEVRIDALTELLLFAADRAQHMSEVINPALTKNEIVVCDRFIDSTLAYQGYGRGVEKLLLEQICALATQGRMPDLTILLDLPVEVGLNRATIRGMSQPEGPDRFEGLAIEFHKRVRDGFLSIAQANAGRFLVLDATLPMSTVVELAIVEIQKRLS